MIEPHRPEDVATSQLETAVRLFAEANYYGAITLAGAAEEVFGKLLELERKRAAGPTDRCVPSTALNGLILGTRDLYPFLFPGETVPADEDLAKQVVLHANRARNALKHLTTDGEPVEFDAREEAVDMLSRAVANCWRLYQILPPVVQDWDASQRAFAPEVDESGETSAP